MKKYFSFSLKIVAAVIINTIITVNLFAQTEYDIKNQIRNVIKKAAEYFDKNISVNGGYVWIYKQDLSRRWGEMEAYPSMVWVQGPGTVEMGHLFLDAYEITRDEYYYNLAKKSAYALTKGQLKCSGWNYMIDFAGEKSLKKWYSTIGANAWRLEEFQHYYGNATFDDDVTAGASKFLLRFYLLKKDKQVEKALSKAIKFILRSQYPNGAWPQRFPLDNVNCKKDYTCYYTFNDNVIWNNIKFLILCYETLDYKNLIEPIKKGMNFYLLSQYKNPQAGWAQQYDFNLEPASARTYEPASLDPQYTARHIEMLIKFYEMTGDKKFIERIPDALNWIESTIIERRDSLAIIPKFVEIGSNKPIYIHRKGTNVKYGKYFFDYNNENTPIHYPCKRIINMKDLYRQFNAAKELNLFSYSDLKFPFDIKMFSSNEVYKIINDYLRLPSEKVFDNFNNDIKFERVNEIISQLDERNRWLTKNVFISNPYINEEIAGDENSEMYSKTYVGDKYDTSPFPNDTDEKYISTRLFIENVSYLLRYLKTVK